MELKLHCLIEFGKHGQQKTRRRFLGWRNGASYGYFIDAMGERAVPQPVRKVEIDHQLNHGQARVIDPDADPIKRDLRRVEELGPLEVLRMEKAWHVVHKLTSHPEIFDKGRRGQLINAAVATDTNVSFSADSFYCHHFEVFVRKVIHSSEGELHHGLASFVTGTIQEGVRRDLLNRQIKPVERMKLMADALNVVIAGPSMYAPERFAGVLMRPTTRELLSKQDSTSCQKLNRMLLEEMYFLDIAKCEHVCGRVTLYKDLRRFWQRGGDKFALQPNYASNRKRGAVGRVRARDRESSRKQGIRKWGAPGKNPGRGVNVTKADQKFFRAIINAHYHGQSRKVSFKRLHELLWDSHYTVTEVAPDGVQTVRRLPRDQVPTEYQLRYFYETNYQLVKRTEKREGKLVMAKRYRAIPGDQTLRCDGPGFEYQIDSTVADIHLVDDSMHYLIGRPTMYLVVDTYSTMIVGVHVTIENAQFSEAAEAIWNAFDDKAPFCTALGINMSGKEWPAAGLPHAILADRGEVLGQKFNDVVTALNIRFGNTPPYRADLKGLVERKFEVIADRKIKWLWGAIPDADYDRSRGDYRKSARLTLRQFTKAVVENILEINASIRRKHHLRSALREAGVPAIPNEIWRWGMKNSTGMLRAASRNYVRSALLPPGTGVVTARGIEFGKLLYVPKDPAVMARLLSTARIKQVWNEQIRHHKYSVKNIYLLGKTYGEVDVCELAPAFRTYERYSWKEWEAVRDDLPSPTIEAAQAEIRRRGNAETDSLQKETGPASEDGGGKLNTKNVTEAREATKDAHGKANDASISATLAPSSDSDAPAARVAAVTPQEAAILRGVDAQFG